jgi:hypothetical protein
MSGFDPRELLLQEGAIAPHSNFFAQTQQALKRQKCSKKFYQLEKFKKVKKN